MNVTAKVILVAQSSFLPIGSLLEVLAESFACTMDTDESVLSTAINFIATLNMNILKVT